MSDVQQRQQNVRVQSIDIVCQENLWDTARAFGLAMIANIAVLVVAATTFHNVGLVILNLQDANTLLEQVLCSLPPQCKMHVHSIQTARLLACILQNHG